MIDRRSPGVTTRRAAGLLSAMALAAVGTTACSTGATQNADFPSKEVKLLIPYAAGGPTDVIGRALAPCMEKDLGQQVVPENIDGASGGLGMQKLKASQPDGHTVALSSTGMVVLTPLLNDLKYSKEDFTPIGEVARVPMNFVVGEKSPHQDMKSLVKAAKAKPGKIKVAVSGASTPQAVELERLKDEYGVHLTVVPFKGSAGATTALLGGHVDAAFLNDSDDVASRIEGGSFRALAVSDAQRQKHLPDTPTLAELGYPKLTLAVTDYSLVGPKGVPEKAVTALSDSLEGCLKDQKTVRKIGPRFVSEQYADAAKLTEQFDKGAAVYDKINKRQ